MPNPMPMTSIGPASWTTVESGWMVVSQAAPAATNTIVETSRIRCDTRWAIESIPTGTSRVGPVSSTSSRPADWALRP